MHAVLVGRCSKVGLPARYALLCHDNTSQPDEVEVRTQLGQTLDQLHNDEERLRACYHSL